MLQSLLAFAGGEAFQPVVQSSILGGSAQAVEGGNDTEARAMTGPKTEVDRLVHFTVRGRPAALQGEYLRPPEMDVLSREGPCRGPNADSLNILSDAAVELGAAVAEEAEGGPVLLGLGGVEGGDEDSGLLAS